MKKVSTSKYAKGKPIGLRSSKVRSLKKPRPAVGVAKRTITAPTPRTRPRLTLGERSRRSALRLLAMRRQHSQLRAAAKLQSFFSRTLAQSAGMLAILAVFGISFLGHAQTSGRTYHATPQACSGWQSPEQAAAIDLLGNEDVASFNPENSATIASRADGAANEPVFKCKGFVLPGDYPTDVDMKGVQLNISLAAMGHPDSVDALVIESSLDGEQWSTLDSFFLTEDTSNAINGGYRTFDFPALNKDNLGSLQVRVRFASVPSEKTVRAYVDGLALAVAVRQVVSAEALNLPKNVVQIEKQNVPISGEPVVRVEVEKQARLKFLGFKDTKRTVDEVQVTTPEGIVQVASFDIQNVTEGTTTYAKVNIHTDTFTRPGKYTAQITVLQDDKLAVVTTEFTWGVLVINMNRSVYWPGETVSFGMGVLDPEGHTVCDAKLVLTIVAPDGTTTVQTTEQTEKGIKRSTTCGRDNVTDVADYSAEYDTYDEGNYAVTLTAKTSSGEYTITDTVIVDAVIPYAISRRGSMRIYPPEAYTMAVDVRPQKNFLGIVEDYVPPSFAITKVSDGGKVIKGQQRTTIRWFVDWKAGTTHTLTYRYDAPDISPEIFRLGPVKIDDYQESRQWQIASDATSGLGLLVYDEDGAVDTTPHYRTWSGTDLSAEGQLANEETANDDVNHTIVECSSARNECIRGALTESGHLDVQVWNGNTSTWSDGGSAPTNGDFTTGIGTTNDVYRGFDIAYEDSTGDGMVVYETSTTANGTIMYRTWDGTNWSGENTITYSGVGSYVAGVAFWVELEADYGSDNILLAFKDGTNNDVYAMRWSGTAWVNSGSDLYTLITGSGVITTKKDFDIAWEGTSGKGKIVFATGSTTGASTYTAGSGWAADSSPFNPGVAVQWISIGGSPNNNYIASMYNAVVSTTGADMYVDMWNGTNWTSVTTPAGDTDINNNGYAQPMDVAWEGGSSDRALFAWRDGPTSELYIRYMVFDIAGHALGSDVFVAPDDDGTGTAECNLTGTATDDNVATGGLGAAENSNGPCSAAAGMAWENEVSGIDLNADPGSAKIMLVGQDLTADLKPEAQLWNGTAAGTWLAQTSNMNAFEIDLSQGATLSTSLPTKAYDFAFYRFSVVTISGTAYTSHTEGATLNSSGGAIQLINITTGLTVSDADGTDGSGLWSIVTNLPANGDILVIYINGATADGTLVLEYGASCTGTPNCTGLKLYQDNVIFRSEHTGNTIVNQDVSGCDADSGTNCADAEIGYTSNLSGTYNLSTSSGRRFFVWTGDTFDPGGTVTTSATGGDLHVDDSAVAYLDTASNVIGRDVLVDGGGTISIDTTTRIEGGDITTSGTSAVVTYSGTPTLTIADVNVCDATQDYIGGGTPTLTFYNLTVGYGGCGTTTISNTTTVANTLSVTWGTLTFAADVSVAGSFTTAESTVINTTGTPTLTLTGTTDLGRTVTGSETITLYNLTTSGTNTVTLKQNLPLTGTLTVGSGTTLTTANNPILTMSGTSKSITGAGSKTLYDLTVTGTITWSGTGTSNVTHNVSVSSGSLTWSGAGTNIITNGISVATGASFAFSVDITSGGAAIAGTGAISYSGTPIYYSTGGSIGGSATGTVSLYKLTASSGTTTIGTASGGVVVANLATVSAGATLSIQNNMSVGAGLTSTTTGIFNGNGNFTLTMTGTGNLGGGNVGTCTVGGLTLAAGVTITQQTSSCQTNGDVTIPATATYNGGTNDLDMFGGTMSGNGTVTFTGGRVRIRQTGDFGGDTAWTFNDLYFDIATITSDQTTTSLGSGQITVNGQLTTTSVPAGEISYDHNLNAGSKTWVLTKSGTGASAPFINDGILTGSTSTFRYTGTTATQIAKTPIAGFNSFYNLELKPNVNGNQIYTPGTSLVVDNNFTVGNAWPDGLDFPFFELDFSLTNISPIIGGTLSCFAPAGDGSQSIYSGTGTWTVTGTFDTSQCFWFSAIGNTLLMNGTAGTIVTSADLYNLNIDPTSAGTVTVNSSNFNVTNTLTVASGDTLSISSGRTVTPTGSGEVAGTGTISGAGKLRFINTSGGPGTTITTLSSIVQFDAGPANIASTTVDARTYAGAVEFYSNVAAVRSITMPTGSFTFSGNVGVITGASQSSVLTLDASNGGASNPTIGITGNLTYTKAGSATPAITTGTGTWTVAGDVTLTNGTFTATAGNTLVMSGAGKTLTPNAQTFQNLTLSGTITLVNVTTYTVAGNLVLGNTVTPGTSTITMTGTSNNITGGGFTLYNLTIDPATAGTITLQTSDLTVSNTLNISASDALTINASRTLTHTGATLTLTGTLNGPGTYIYRSTTTFPTTGTLAASLILRFDMNGGNQIMSQRTDYQLVEVDNSSTTAGRTLAVGTAGSQTITLAGKLELMNTGADPSTTIVDFDTNDPAFTVGGDTTIALNTTLTAPSGGALNLKGNYANSGTFTHSSGIVTVNGTGEQTFSGGMLTTNAFNTLTITNTNGTYTNDSCGTPSAFGVIFSAAMTTGTLNIATAGVKVQFLAGATYTVSSTLNLQGSVGNRVVLRSSAASVWTLAAPVTQTVTYVDVSYSTATGNSVVATDGTNKDCGNNTGWTFTLGIDVAGTSNSSGGTVKVAVNGTIQAQTTTLAASWTITSVTVNSGDKVTVFVDAAAEAAETTGVTKYDGTGNIGGLALDTNVLTVGSDDNASLVLTDLGLYDNDQSEDVMQTANASVLTVDGGATYSTEQITIKASNTLTIGTTETLSTHHLSNAGTLVGTGSATFDVFGNWTNTSTFTQNTSTVTFKSTGTGKTINNGASSFYNVIFNGSGGAWSPLTNTLTVTNDLIMTAGTFNTATGTANVTVNGNVQCLTTCGTITMNSAGTNTFTQSVSASKSFGTNVAVGTNWTFNNLTFTASSGTPTITFNGTGTGQVIVGATLSTTNGGTSLVVDNETNDRIIDANGAVTIGAGTTFQASSTAAFNVAGNWTNNGDFTDGSGLVTLDGGSQQTVDGQLTGANDRFNNLTITNASGSDPVTSPSVIFAAALDTAGTFNASTASTKLRFLAAGTYTLQNLTLNGQATGTRVALRSSTGGTQWNVNVAGTRAVTYTEVKDSNACGQAPDIDASDGTSHDIGGNTCWNIHTLTFTINDVAVGFGTLSPTAATWANAGATGSASAVAAHTLAITTSAFEGYALSYNGANLAGPETITAATFTGDPDGTQNSKQFALAITTNGSGTIPTAYQQASNNYSYVPSTTTGLLSKATATPTTETASVYYICNIAATTLPGAYSTAVTYIVTGTF